MRGPRWLPAAAITVFAAGLAWLNRGERVALDVGIATFYRAPLTVVLFLAFLAGMLSMLLLSLRQDMRTREELRARGILDIPARPAAPAAPAAVPTPAAPVWTQPDETVAHLDAASADDRTAAYLQYDEEPPARVNPPPAEDRTVGDPRHDEEPAVRADPPPAEDRTVVYRRYDEDPAA